MIIRRFEKFTGVEAVHATTGTTFAAIAEQRRVAPVQDTPAEQSVSSGEAHAAGPTQPSSDPPSFASPSQVVASPSPVADLSGIGVLTENS